MKRSAGGGIRWRRLARLLFSRSATIALILLAELLWLVIFFLKLTDYAVWIRPCLTILSIVIVLYLMCKEENPAYKLTWVFLILILPLFGGMMYLMFGNKRPSRRMRKKLQSVEDSHGRCLLGADRLPIETSRLAGTCRYLSDCGNFPAFVDTQVDYFPSGERLFARLMDDLATAERYIFMEYFIFAEGSVWEQVFRVLSDRAAHGVDVRIIYDDVGSVTVLPAHMKKRLCQAGIRVMAFNPVAPVLTLAFNNRDHRKITVIDGRVAYTGGVNIADEYVNRISPYGYWKDTGLRLCGEAAGEFAVMFLDLWNAFRPTEKDYTPFLPGFRGHGTGIVQPFYDTPLDEENLAENVYLDILSQAKDYVYIYTPYLIIDHEMQTALTLAAKRGVDVRIVTPGIPDKKRVYHLTRSYYGALLAAGVRIYEYTPGFLHAKSFVSDDRIAVVGTINLDFRSLYLHFECGTLLIDDPAVLRIRQDFRETLDKCRSVRQRECRKYAFPSLGYLILRIFSPLF